MAEPVTLDRHTSAVLSMDFQIRIVNNFASDPQGVVERAAKGNKLRDKDGITESPRGYLTSNIDPASSHGVWFQLAEG